MIQFVLSMQNQLQPQAVEKIVAQEVKEKHQKNVRMVQSYNTAKFTCHDQIVQRVLQRIFDLI